MKKKEIKLCDDYSHDWYEVGKCKDALGKHPCKYHPEGCDTCMTRFECYTKDTDTYRSRVSGIFYACRKCPAIKLEGTITSWDTEQIRSKSEKSNMELPFGLLDIRKSTFFGLEKDLANKLRNRWKECDTKSEK